MDETLVNKSVYTVNIITAKIEHMEFDPLWSLFSKGILDLGFPENLEKCQDDENLYFLRSVTSHLTQHRDNSTMFQNWEDRIFWPSKRSLLFPTRYVVEYETEPIKESGMNLWNFEI